MTKPFDPTKPVQTRDGRKARIICTDKESVHTIVALIKKSCGTEYAQTYLRDGLCYLHRESDEDLINIPERKSRWQGLFENGTTGVFCPSKKEIEHRYPDTTIGILEYIYEAEIFIGVELHKAEK